MNGHEWLDRLPGEPDLLSLSPLKLGDLAPHIILLIMELAKCHGAAGRRDRIQGGYD